MNPNSEEMKALKALLEELYSYYYGVGKAAFNRSGDDDFDYEETKSFGAVDAIGTIYLACFGSKEMMRLWLENCESDPATGD